MYQPMAPCMPPSAKYAEALQRKAAAQLAHQPEGDERQREGDADEAPEEAVGPLPPEDGLESLERHAGIDDGVLRDGLVLVEGGEPIGLVERRYRAEQRLPFGDRQPAVGQTHRTADDDHAKDERGDEQQPHAHGGTGPRRGDDVTRCGGNSQGPRLPTGHSRG